MRGSAADGAPDSRRLLRPVDDQLLHLLRHGMRAEIDNATRRHPDDSGIGDRIDSIGVVSQLARRPDRHIARTER